MISFSRFAASSGAIFCVVGGVVLAQAPAPSPTIPYVVPGQTGHRAPLDFFLFSWQEFYALNWPAEVPAGQPPRRGAPDRTKTIGDLGVPRVWETWKTDYELFPPQPATGEVTPTPWESWVVAAPVCSPNPTNETMTLLSTGWS